MKKILLFVFVSVLFVGCENIQKHSNLVCHHDHKVNNQSIEGLSCTKDGICTVCHELILASGHSWVEANCTSAKTCSICGQVEGKALGHDIKDGTCQRCNENFFEPLSYFVDGDCVISDISLGSHHYVAHISYLGNDHFRVYSYDSSGHKDLLINEMDDYDGTLLLNSLDLDKIEIKSNGKWTLRIEEVQKGDIDSFSGIGDDVTSIFSANSGSWKISHDGDGHFIVNLYKVNGYDCLINEIGYYSGSQYIKIPSGSQAFFEIIADGKWTITKE